MFISAPHAGHWYIAQLSRVGYHKLLWSIMPVAPTAADTRIEAGEVPKRIRRAAYRHLEQQKGQTL